jgi:hypothetical protein
VSLADPARWSALFISIKEPIGLRWRTFYGSAAPAKWAFIFGAALQAFFRIWRLSSSA